MKQAIKLKKHLQRDKRKQEKAEKNLYAEQQKLLSVIKSRGINLVSYYFEKVSKLEDMEFPSPELRIKMPNKVHFGEDGKLVWPVLFGYPEVEACDYIKEFHEDVTIECMLSEMLSESPEWDTKHQYNLNDVAIYFEGRNPSTLYKVDTNETLGNIISNKRFVVCCGTPVFYVFPKPLANPEKYQNLPWFKKENWFFKTYLDKTS